MTEEGEISSPDMDEHEISGENVVNVLDDILGDPANDEFAAELDTKPTTPITPEAPGLPELSIKPTTKKTSSENKSNEVVKEKPESKLAANETKVKPKPATSKKTKVGSPKIQPKTKAPSNTSGSGPEKPKKTVKSSATKESNQETVNAAKEKNNSNPAKLKTEMKPKEVVKTKVSQKTKTGIKTKTALASKATKTVAKDKSVAASANVKKSAETAIPENKNEANEKPTAVKKKVIKKVVKKLVPSRVAAKTVKPKSAASNKEVKQGEQVEKNNKEKVPVKDASESKEKVKIAADSKSTTTDGEKPIKTEKAIAKKRPASSKVAAVKAKKAKQDEKKPVMKTKSVAAKKPSVKAEAIEEKPKKETEGKEPEKKEDIEESKHDDVEMKEYTDEVVKDATDINPTSIPKIEEQSDNQMTVVDDVGNSSPGGSAGNSRQQSRSRSGSRSSYSSNKSGSDVESREGEKESRKRRHKSISPIVFDKEKDTSGSESDSSGSEDGSDTPVKSKVDKVEKPNIDEYLDDARFFIMKSSNYENVSLSKAKGVWSTPYANEKRINFSLKKYRNVILIYSIKESGKFQGFARVLGEAEYGGRPVPWVLPPGLNARALGGVFKLEWLNRKELPFSKCSHLRNPYNDNKDVKICRDGQEVEPNVGRLLCKLFPEDENVKLASKRRSSREKEHKKVDDESPRRRSRRHSSPSSHRRKRRRRDREGRHRSRERYDGMGNMIDPRSRYGVRKETLMHGSYSDYVREFHRSRQPPPAFAPYRGMDPYAVVYTADFMRHERHPGYNRRRR